MAICRICHFETELDDVAVGSPAGRCVCLRCFGRATNTARPVPQTLRVAISAVLAVCAPVEL